jgi:hypothetical protein
MFGFSAILKRLPAPGMIVLAIGCAILAGVAGMSFGQLNPRWDPLYDPGNLGRVEGIRISPYNSDTILVGGDVFGVGLTTDGGIIWQQCTGFLCGCDNDFTWHPTDPNTVWAGTLGGPYKSTDGGKTWTLKRNGMGTPSPTGITVPIQKVLYDPNNSSTLLAIAGNHREMGYSAPGYGTVWKSTNGGDNWTQISTIVSGVIFDDAGFAPGSSSIVYACSSTRGVYKSINGGASWAPVNTGLPNTLAWSLAFHPTDPNTLWVSIGNGVGVYKTTNGGASWFASNSGMSNGGSGYCISVTVCASNPNYLYAAFWQGTGNTFRSTNGGASWQQIITQGSHATIIGGTGNVGVFVFQWINVDPNNPLHVVGACEGMDVQTWDGGNTWKDITNYAANGGWRGNGYSGLAPSAIRWNPYIPGQIFTVGFDQGKLERSIDYFWSWKTGDSANLHGPYNGANDVTFAADGTIYVASGQFTNTDGVYTNEPIIKSINGGSSWSYITRPVGATAGNRSVYVNPTDSKQLWCICGYTTSGTLYQSNDGGSTWTQPTLSGSGTVWTIAADPINPLTFYVAATNGVYKTTDGLNFVKMSGSPTSNNFAYMFMDRATSTPYYVAFNAGSLGGVYRFSGGAWTRIFTNSQARAVEVDPHNPQRIIVLTQGFSSEDVTLATGVYITVNGGTTWTICNQGLRMPDAVDVKFNPDNSNQVILGSLQWGFYATDLGTSTPFGGGSPPSAVGTIQAENYDLGGERSAYHDPTSGDATGNTYRTDGVKIRTGGTGNVVTNLTAGEWIKYQLNVPATDYYDLTLHVSSASGGGKFHFNANGVNVTGPIAINSTGGANTFADVVVHNVRLVAGTQYFTLYVENGGADVDFFSLASTNVHVISVASNKPDDVQTTATGLIYNIDNANTITSLSGNLLNQQIIRSYNSDKTDSSASELTFSLGQSSTAYVAYDKRATSSPSWLSSGNGWALTSETFNTTDSIGASPFKVYGKDFPAGSVTLGGNLQAPASGAQVNYVVIVKPDSTMNATLAINGGTAQRSQIQSATVTFDTAVTLDSGAISVSRRTAGAVTVASSNPSGDGRAWQLAFSGTSTLNGMLIDGIYDVTVVASKVHALGFTLGTDRAFTFHRLYGDYNGDKTVNNTDAFQFNKAYGTSAGQSGYQSFFDYDGNQTINNTDAFQFNKRYGTSLVY